MPGWSEILTETQTEGNDLDSVRRKYVKELSKKTGRNTIAYYSGWLSKGSGMLSMVNDDDKNGFMTTVYGMDRSKGLDLILHTEGGDIAAAESIVNYLLDVFKKDVRAIIPQMAMSAGTMIAFSCKSIVMGRQSSLGPYDPHIRGLPAHGIIEEFKKAKDEIIKEPALVNVWRSILNQYNPTLLGTCENAIRLSDELVKKWLSENMFSGDPDSEAAIQKIANLFGSRIETKLHARQINYIQAKNTGLRIEMMEEEQDLQDAILSVHHAFIVTLTGSRVIKIIENQDSRTYIRTHTS
ncbi:MAG: hypothetical protein LRY50_16050 [Geovibrio sp.]|nr:hypothetical protein [Geovibrio sp.]